MFPRCFGIDSWVAGRTSGRNSHRLSSGTSGLGGHDGNWLTKFHLETLLLNGSSSGGGDNSDNDNNNNKVSS